MFLQSSNKITIGKILIVGIVMLGLMLPNATINLAFAQETGEGQEESGGSEPEVTVPEDPPETSGGEEAEGTGSDSDGNDGEGAEGTAIIVTGNAGAEGDIENVVNTNEVNTEEDEDEPEEEVITDETSDGEGDLNGDSEGEGEELGGGGGGGSSIEVENNNEAEIENEGEVEAETGENTIEDAGNAIIDTGDAIATANVINVVNTNIFNSEGLFLFLNGLFGSNRDIDLRDVDWFDAPNANIAGGEEAESESEDSVCGIYNCEVVQSYQLQNNNTANIINSVVVRASTGRNSASGNGDSYISTGNAYAAANVVNVANTNIVDSNYLLLSFNNFGDWGGDIVFPGSSFFGNIFGGISGSPACNGASNISVTNNNEANIENEITAEADTGENEITGGDASSTAEIYTGDATANAAATNVVNTNILCDTSFAIVFRIYGNWGGNVFSAPEGVYWTETDEGIEIYGEGLLEEAPEGEATTEGSGSDQGDINIENNNNANILNNIEVIALTGENRISGGSGVIDTGNAYAAASVFNIVNTNIVGRNWILAVINIFGDWDGDIAFGRPDLWVGESISVPENPVSPGGIVRYNFTVMNNGDAPATEVQLNDVFDIANLTLGSGDYSTSGEDGVFWNLGTIPPGGTIEASYEVQVNPEVAYGQTLIENTVSVSSLEPDEDDIDNTDTASFIVLREASAANRSGSIGTRRSPGIKIVKTNNATGTVLASSTVDYKIVIENETQLLDAVLVDTLTDEDGNIINEELWDFGRIEEHERITVTYTMEFTEALINGTYTNSAQIMGTKTNNQSYKSPIATNVIEFDGGIDPNDIDKEEVTIESDTEEITPEVAPVNVIQESVEKEIITDEDDGGVQSSATGNSLFLASIGGIFSSALGWSLLITLIGLMLTLFILRRRNHSK